MRLLSENATLVISGTRIAEELGTTRSEVWRAIQHLRELGVQITGHQASGYQLDSVADLLLPDIVGPMVNGTMFAERMQHYFRIGSTNAAAMEAASKGEAEGAVFFAEQQTAGRGRGGNSWESAASDGIYCSVVLRPKLSPADALLLSLIAGIAVAEAVEHTTGLHPDLRWPNDVLIEERKFCGILTEMNAEATRVRYVVVGIGINVNQASFPAELEPIATSLRLAAGHEWSRVQVAAALLKSLDTWYRKLTGGGTNARAAIFEQFETAVIVCALATRPRGRGRRVRGRHGRTRRPRIPAGAHRRRPADGTVRRSACGPRSRKINHATCGGRRKYQHRSRCLRTP